MWHLSSYIVNFKFLVMTMMTSAAWILLFLVDVYGLAFKDVLYWYGIRRLSFLDWCALPSGHIKWAICIHSKMEMLHA